MVWVDKTVGRPDAGRTIIRVAALNSGTALIAIRGALDRQFTVDFGLVPGRKAAALGVIAAAKLLLHEGVRGPVHVSVTNLDFARYALREQTPREKEMREVVEHVWKTLSRFRSWTLSFAPAKRHRLSGGPSGKFPHGVFPWLKAEVRKENGALAVTLPDCPAVLAQFQASIRTARQAQGVRNRFTVPLAAEQVVCGWIAAVRERMVREG